MKNNRLRACVALLPVLLVAVSARGFVFDTNPETSLPLKWPAGVVTFRVGLGTDANLSDGHSFNSSFQTALDVWNGALGALQLIGDYRASVSVGSDNGVNEVLFATTYGGRAFDTNTVAITLSSRIVSGGNNERVEADIIFNSTRSWDSYRGPQRPSVDLQRVAIHEVGHALGLDHPDEAGQSVTAIMNSRVGNLDTAAQDDITGAQKLYGPPGVPDNDAFSAARALSFSGDSARDEGFNTRASKEPGEPNHAANAGGRSVWWRWTAPSAGNFTLNTQGSVFDTTLAVYTGAGLGALAEIASDDDVQDSRVQYSTVTFATTRGATYHFAVDGFAADNGAIVLNATFDGVLAPTEQTVSSGRAVTFSAGSSGSFRWQISTDGGSSFSDLSDNATYSGANTATLTINNVPASLNGAFIRVVSTNGGTVTPGTTFLLNVATIFAPNPTGILSNANGNLSLADSALNTVQQITSAGAITTFVGSANTAGSTDAIGAAARFNLPYDLARNAAGALFLADSGNSTIRRLATDGTVTTLAGSPTQRGGVDGAGVAATFNGPSGVAVDANGNVFVADEFNHTIRRITPAGIVTTFAGASGLSGIANGTGAAARFNHPTRLTFDPSGNLYVADTFNHTIRKITSGGLVTTFAGLEGVTGTSDGAGLNALFNKPGGLATDSAGNLYVADTGNSTIRKVTPAGVVSTLAGLGTISGLKDGTGGDAWFNQPLDLALDGAGDLYVADTGNAVIRKITPAGAVTTLKLSVPSVAPIQPTPSSPPPATTQTPAPTGNNEGGGGAPSVFFLAALATLLGIRRWSAARS
jgi:hypothetical protein